MYSIFVTIDVKPEHVEEFTQASFGDARGSVRDEPGCFRFDINQDQEIPGRFYLYESLPRRRGVPGPPRSAALQGVDRHRQADVRPRPRVGVDEHGVPLRLGVGTAEGRTGELVAIRRLETAAAEGRRKPPRQAELPGVENRPMAAGPAPGKNRGACVPRTKFLRYWRMGAFHAGATAPRRPGCFRKLRVRDGLRGPRTKALRLSENCGNACSGARPQVTSKPPKEHQTGSGFPDDYPVGPPAASKRALGPGSRPSARARRR